MLSSWFYRYPGRLLSIGLFHIYNNVYIIVGTLLSGVALAQDNKAHTFLFIWCLRALIHISVHELKCELYKFKAEKMENFQ